jgi:hypothetical protein
MRQHSSSMAQWTDIIGRTGPLKIWTFMLTRQWIYQDLQSDVVCHPGVLRDRVSLKEQLLVLSTSACLRNPLFPPFITVWRWGNLLATRQGTPRYHHEVRAYLDDNFPDRWIGRRGSVEYTERSPDLAPLDSYLWDYLKDSLYSTKTATLQELRHDTEQSCAGIPADTLVNVCHSVVGRCQHCLEVNGGHFENLR